MKTATILEEIVAKRRQDVAADKAGTPMAHLERLLDSAHAATSLAGRLRASAPIAVMAEIKRASPSKGDIALDIDAADQAATYAKAGAAAISVLTEPNWFKGALGDLSAVRSRLENFPAGRPALLRKEFIVDPYQVLESRVAGADALLLIVACLTDADLRDLMKLTAELGMEALVEVNSSEEMKRALDAGATMVGVNNRDLHTFNVDLGTTERVADGLPPGILLAALSGISTREDVRRFQDIGAAAVLVGEALMRAEDPAAKIAELRGV
jgi:anthranilate synthase / indole-3-glycerol phosphate synthase / phosphoribosylanthranilate isomerase